MCGLTGIYSNSFLTIDEKKLFQALLIGNYLRGKDSTGLIIERADGKVSWTKSLEPSPVFTFSDEFSKSLMPKDGKQVSLVMGHTRHGTIGKNIIDNAHPFETPNFVGMHNGTIMDTFEGTENYGTDSEALYNLISRDGVIPALQYIHRECWEPAYALQMVSYNSDSSYFVRNEERSLWFAGISSGSTIVWSSSIINLKWALYSLGFKAFRPTWLKHLANSEEYFDFDSSFKPSESPFFQPKPGVLMDLDTSKTANNAITVNTFEIPEYSYSSVPFGTNGRKTKDHGGKKPLALTTSAGDSLTKEAILKAMNRQIGTNISTPDMGKKKKEKKNQPSIKKKGMGVFQNYRGFGNRIMRKKEVLSCLEAGCATCGISVAEDDYNEIADLKWISPKLFSCTHCQSVYTELELQEFAMT